MTLKASAGNPFITNGDLTWFMNASENDKLTMVIVADDGRPPLTWEKLVERINRSPIDPDTQLHWKEEGTRNFC